jgi:NAD+ kinase
MAIPQPSLKKLAAILSRPARPEVTQILPGLLAWLHDHGYGVVFDLETAQYMTAPEVEIIPRAQLSTRPLDLVIVLGGDGTLLAAARHTASVDVPLLGVNLGSLGFLTEVPVASLYSMLEDIAIDHAPIEKRPLMECELLRGDDILSSHQIFNDAVVNKTALARLNKYELYIDKVFVSSYRADGMIIATPTGSTAYSLSAGGPVLMPSVDAFVITPVAPHSFSHRPLVVPDSVEIEILLRSGNDFAYLSLDGQPGLDLLDGDRIRCRRSAHDVSLFRMNDNFFEVLRSKLKWGEGTN